jgi:hypothetical protein
MENLKDFLVALENNGKSKRFPCGFRKQWKI